MKGTAHHLRLFASPAVWAKTNQDDGNFSSSPNTPSRPAPPDPGAHTVARAQLNDRGRAARFWNAKSGPLFYLTNVCRKKTKQSHEKELTHATELSDH